MSKPDRLGSVEIISYARQVATHAQGLGVEGLTPRARSPYSHIGAALADSVLQAGLNYRTVVAPRVERIVRLYPETASISPLMTLIDEGRLPEFLRWNGHEKISRFKALSQFVLDEGVIDCLSLNNALCYKTFRENLRAISGIGPKTVDYLCCLVGVDVIAVDRHVRTFASEAGVTVQDYYGLQTVVSYAADLLGYSRRDFDAWIWQAISGRQAGNQFELALAG